MISDISATCQAGGVTINVAAAVGHDVGDISSNSYDKITRK